LVQKTGPGGKNSLFGGALEQKHREKNNEGEELKNFTAAQKAFKLDKM